MIIDSRGHLLHLLDNYAIETYLHISKPNAEIKCTIIYNKDKDKFYRIKWGEVSDRNNIRQLWYDDTAEEVHLNKIKDKDGWFTKEEIRHFNNNPCSIEHNIDDYLLHRVENNLIYNENNVYTKIKEKYNSKGTIWYSYIKTINALKKGKTVLFFTIEKTKEEIIDNILYVAKSNNVEINKQNLIIDYNKCIDENYIINKMKQQSNHGLDLVVIQTLNFNEQDKYNIDYLDKIERELESVSEKLNCEILITTRFC